VHLVCVSVLSVLVTVSKEWLVMSAVHIHGDHLSENMEMSGNFKDVREKSWKFGQVRDLSGKK